MGLLKKPRSEMIPEKLQTREEEKVNSRPLSVLAQLVKNNTPVPINCRNNRKLLDTVKASDGHCNTVLETRRRGGLRFPRVARARRSPSQSTRTATSQRYSCAGSSWSCETRSSLTRRGLLPAVRTYPSFLFVKQQTKILRSTDIPFKTATLPHISSFIPLHCVYHLLTFCFT